jgi:hypothetical protein
VYSPLRHLLAADRVVVPGIKAQVLLLRNIGTSHHNAVQGRHQQLHVVPVGAGHGDGQRAAQRLPADGWRAWRDQTVAVPSAGSTPAGSG